LGLKEVRGSGDNPEIVDWMTLTTLPQSMWCDATAWCSVFVNAGFELNGFRGTRSAAAASWLTWGQKLTKPFRGCVAVFSRDGGHHVAWFLRDLGNSIEVIGGNQSNAVTRAAYSKERLLGYRAPKGWLV
jgi:uncharacterized protein (TIGR02594 family)